MPGLNPTGRYPSYPEAVLVFQQYAVLDQVDCQDTLQFIEAKDRPGIGSFYRNIPGLLVEVRGRQNDISIALQHLVAKLSSYAVDIGQVSGDDKGSLQQELMLAFSFAVS